MKKIKKLATIMIIMVAAVLSTVSLNAQGYAMTYLTQPVSADGKIYTGHDLGGQHIALSYVDNAYTSEISKIRDVAQITQDIVSKGQKIYITTMLTVYPGIDTLQVSIKNPFTDPVTGKKGSFQLSKNANGTGIFRTLPLQAPESDADSFIINTADGSWTPAVFDGVPGFFVKQWYTEIDTVLPTDLDASGHFYMNWRCDFWANKYPVKSPSAPGSRIALFYRNGGGYTSVGYQLTGGPTSAGLWPIMPNKKIQARFNKDVLSANYTEIGAGVNNITLNARHYPSNYYDSTHSRFMVVDLYDSITGSLVESQSWSSYWDQVDQWSVDSLRTDLIFKWMYFNSLKSGHPYQVRYAYIDNNVKTYVFTYNIRTLAPPAVKPVFTDLILKSVNTNNITVNLQFTRGNIDTFPIILRLLDNNGVVLPDYAVSVYGSGVYNADIQRINLESFKYYTIVATQNGVILKSIPFRTLGVDAVINPSSLQTGSVDVTPETPVYTLLYTAGSIDNPGVAKFVVTVTGPSGQVAQYDKTTVAGQMTAQSLQIPMDFGVIVNTDYTVSVSQVSYPDGVNLVTKTVGSFNFRKSSSSISGVSVTGVSAYIDGSGMLQIAGVPNRVTKQVYNLSGSQIGTFNESFDMNIYPSGIYFLTVDGQSIKFVK